MRESGITSPTCLRKTTGKAYEGSTKDKLEGLLQKLNNEKNELNNKFEENLLTTEELKEEISKLEDDKKTLNTEINNMRDTNDELSKENHDIYILTRHPEKFNKQTNLTYIGWLTKDAKPEKYLAGPVSFVDIGIGLC